MRCWRRSFRSRCRFRSGAKTQGTRRKQVRFLAEFDSSGDRSRRYTYTGGFAPAEQVVASGSTEAVQQVHVDHLDTPRGLTSDSATVAWRAADRAFGATTPDEDPDGDLATVAFAIRFPGQLADQESSLHYNRFRYCEPSIGRYISADPIGQWGGVNVFAYAMNDPLRYIDPDGRDFQENVRAFFKAGPYDAHRAGGPIRDQAFDIAGRSGLPGPHNGAQDAYRHCVWTCEMGKQLNKEDASQIAAEHERAGARAKPPQPDAERKMDEANNRAGLECSEKPRDCTVSCMDNLGKGGLFGPGGAPMSPPSSTLVPPSNPGPSY